MPEKYPLNRLKRPRPALTGHRRHKPGHNRPSPALTLTTSEKNFICYLARYGSLNDKDIPDSESAHATEVIRSLLAKRLITRGLDGALNSCSILSNKCINLLWSLL
jgi:hypothetical protein